MGKKIFVLSLGILFISGCATTRFISNPTPPQELKISGQDQNFEAVLDYIILPNGSAAWVKDALWDEYALTIRNLSDKALTIEKIRLIDPRGVYIDGGINPYQLESATKALAAVYKEAGIGVAVGVGTTALAIAAPLAFTPVAIVALPLYEVYSLSKAGTDISDREKIDKEFARRNLSTVTLAGNATIAGSAFFPIVPSPKALVIDYRMKSEIKTLEISLEKLAVLHVAPKNPQKTSPEEKGK